ncbi:uncharacterized protein G2W53_021324 [Senna tora]|uniref:Uncharacterized protein n=1 Tax=Senna tora TaxID=362788 RepID=A0A834TLN6_9FABA|nr:uncharacterized protein G2W53_021324 [Senna tora]
MGFPVLAPPTPLPLLNLKATLLTIDVYHTMLERGRKDPGWRLEKEELELDGKHNAYIFRPHNSLDVDDVPKLENARGNRNKA